MCVFFPKNWYRRFKITSSRLVRYEDQDLRLRINKVQWYLEKQINIWNATTRQTTITHYLITIYEGICKYIQAESKTIKKASSHFNLVNQLLFKLDFEKKWINIKEVNYYSETTWAVGIAQLTHHSVRGGDKNPEAEGRGIFAPALNLVLLLSQTLFG